MNQFTIVSTSQSPLIRFNYSSPTHKSDALPVTSNLFQLTNKHQISKPGVKINLFQNKRLSNNPSSPIFLDRKEIQFSTQIVNKQRQVMQLKKPLCQSSIINSNNDMPLKELKFQNRLSNLADRRNIYFNGLKKSCIPMFEPKYNGQFLNKALFKNQSQPILEKIQKQNIPLSIEMKFNFSKMKVKLRRPSSKVSNAKIQDFQIGQLLGKGSFGRVYMVRHRVTGFFFALKNIKKSSVKDTDQLIIGIKSHLFIDHPNLAKLYACFSDQQNLYLLMELCVHGNLSKYKKKITTDEQKDNIIQGIAKGIKYMHQHVLRHGDIKLQNILICHGFPKITDFDCIVNGNQKSFLQIRRKSKMWGSPAYFSPGMMTDSTFALQDDIWSLGVIMYQLYCNSHPFDLKDSDDLSKIVDQQMISMPKQIKKEAQQLIEKMLDKKRQSRATLQEILTYFM